jgi:hypothetical protein
MHLLIATRPFSLGDIGFPVGTVLAKLQILDAKTTAQVVGRWPWTASKLMTPAQAAAFVATQDDDARARFAAAMGSDHVDSQQAAAVDQSALDAALARVAELEQALADAGGGMTVEGFAADASVGQIAYDSYVAQAGGVSLVTGAPLPTWDALTDAIRAGWCAAAGAVLASQAPPLDPVNAEPFVLETDDLNPVAVTPTPIADLDITDRQRELLAAAGVTTVEHLAAADASSLATLNGIGKATAPKLIQAAQDHLKAAAVAAAPATAIGPQA